MIFSYTKRLSICKCYRFLNHAKQFATDALKTILKKVFQKTAEAIGNFIGKKLQIKL